MTQMIPQVSKTNNKQESNCTYAQDQVT